MMTGYYNRQIRLGVSDSQPIYGAPHDLGDSTVSSRHNPGRSKPRNLQPDPPATQSLAEALVPRRIHVALPDLVASTGSGRCVVLLQQPEVPECLAGLFLALVLRRSCELRAPRSGLARCCRPDDQAVCL